MFNIQYSIFWNIIFRCNECKKDQMKDLCFLVSYPTRWSLLSISGSLYGSSKQQRNIVQLCTICFPTIEREKGLHRLEGDILISVYTKHIMHASETHKEPCHKPLSSRSRSLRAHQENVKIFFAVWPVVVLEAPKEEQHEDSFASELSWLRTLTIKAALW